jgi:hypothetical protein
LFGPSASELSDMLRFGINVARHTVDGKPYTTRDAAILRQAAPFQNLIWTRAIFDHVEREAIGQSLLGIPDYKFNARF